MNTITSNPILTTLDPISCDTKVTNDYKRCTSAPPKPPWTTQSATSPIQDTVHSTSVDNKVTINSLLSNTMEVHKSPSQAIFDPKVTTDFHLVHSREMHENRGQTTKDPTAYDTKVTTSSTDSQLPQSMELHEYPSQAILDSKASNRKVTNHSLLSHSKEVDIHTSSSADRQKIHSLELPIIGMNAGEKVYIID